MDILLVNPPYARLQGIRTIYFPIGLGYLSSVLEAAGHRTRIYNGEMPGPDENVESVFLTYQDKETKLLDSHGHYVASLDDPRHPAWTDYVGVLESFRPEMVGIGTTSTQSGSALRLSEITKATLPGTHVVWGGSHPTILPDSLSRYDCVDFFVRGEGEETTCALASSLESGETDFSAVRGASFKRDGGVVHNPARDRIQDLDRLPFPNLGALLYPERYYEELRNGIDVISSRGCPYDCGYCGARNIWGKQVRYRSARNFVDEIENVVRQTGTREFFFWDDSFTVNRKRAIEICEEIVKRRLGIVWGVTTRADLLDDALVRTMRRSGCLKIDIGIESGSPRILEIMGKGETVEQYRAAAEILNRNGIVWGAFYMVGFPDETEEDVVRTMDLMKELKSTNRMVSVFTPYPGTALYQHTKELGMIPDDLDWDTVSHHSPDNYFARDISRERFRELMYEMTALADRLNNRFSNLVRLVYFRRHYFFRNPSRFVRIAASFVFRMLFRKRTAARTTAPAGADPAGEVPVAV